MIPKPCPSGYNCDYGSMYVAGPPADWTFFLQCVVVVVLIIAVATVLSLAIMAWADRKK